MFEISHNSMESVRAKEKIAQKNTVNIDRSEVNKDGNFLRACELFITFLIAISLFCAVFRIRDLQKKVDVLVVENCKLWDEFAKLKAGYNYRSDYKVNTNSYAKLQDVNNVGGFYVRRLQKREIFSKGEKTSKQLADDYRLVKEINDVSENNTVAFVTEPNFDSGNETESPVKNYEPKLRALVPTLIPPMTHSSTKSGHGRKSTREKPLQKKFAAIAMEKPEQRNRDLSFERIKPVAVHFSASLSNHSLRHHPLHKGNGLVTLPSPLYQYWMPIEWIHDLNMTDSFCLEGSDIKVSRKGIYFLYAQIQYTTNKDHNGYKVYRNSEPIAQCIFTKASDHPEPSVQTCSLTTVVALSPDDKIYIQDISHNPTVALSPEKSFFGLVLISPT